MVQRTLRHRQELHDLRLQGRAEMHVAHRRAGQVELLLESLHLPVHALDHHEQVSEDVGVDEAAEKASADAEEELLHGVR